MLLGGAGRFACAFLSGVIFFGANAPQGQAVWLYSLVYNLSYLAPSIVACTALGVLLVPALERAVPAHAAAITGVLVVKALIVCAAPVSGYEAHVLGLAATVDLVLAADGGARLCFAAGVTPDVVVGDLDSLDAGRLSLQPKSDRIPLVSSPRTRTTPTLTSRSTKPVAVGPGR